MFIKTKVKPIARVDDEMNINPKRVKIGMKNPRVLKHFLIFFFENFSDLINLSLNKAESMMKRKHVRNGIDDNSPFFNKIDMNFE
jgi:hypothetical protein